MEKYTVILHSLEQVQEFIHAIEKIPFHMDIGAGAVVIDAKSSQGIISMGLNKKLPLTVHGELTAEMKKELISFIVTE